MSRRSPRRSSGSARRPIDRIHAARREENHVRAVPPRGLEAVDRAGEVGLEHVGRAAAVAGVHGGLGRTFEQQVERAGVGEVVRRADVAVHEVDAACARSRSSASSLPRRLRLSKAQTWTSVRSRFSISARLGSDEPGAAGNEDSHERFRNDPTSCEHVMISDAMLKLRVDPLSLDTLYATRFPEADRDAKDAIWRVLCPHFFQRYVKPDDVVLDIGAGFGEFLRHIRCGKRIAVDIEQPLRPHAARRARRKSSRRAISCRRTSRRTPSTSSSAATSSSTCRTRRRFSRR